MRMGCSPLRSHLCLLLHVIPNSNCDCGFLIESPKHFFLEYPLYAGERDLMKRKIELITDCVININIILFGCKDLSYKKNKKIFRSVQKFIKDTGRFGSDQHCDPGASLG